MSDGSGVSTEVERIWPKWMRDVAQLLPVRSQFVLSGNTRDSVAFTDEKGLLKLVPLNTTIRHLLAGLGYQCVLLWDPLDGLQVLAGNDEHGEQLTSLLGPQLGSLTSTGVEELGQVIRRVALPPPGVDLTVGLIVDFSSRLADEGRLCRL